MRRSTPSLGLTVLSKHKSAGLSSNIFYGEEKVFSLLVVNILLVFEAFSHSICFGLKPYIYMCFNSPAFKGGATFSYNLSCVSFINHDLKVVANNIIKYGL